MNISQIESMNFKIEVTDRQESTTYHQSGLAIEVMKEETRVEGGKDFKQSMIDLAGWMVSHGLEQDIIRVESEE